MQRYLIDNIAKDLPKKMVFLVGPRQVGKTTASLALLQDKSGYLNWDTDEGRASILDKEFGTSKLLVFDEIHKYRKWRNYLKGIYDSPLRDQQILVSGSAKLDWYRFGGDSLQGRYFLHRLHPLSVAELGISAAHEFEHLLLLGGFPEPFLSGSVDEARRWSKLYRMTEHFEDTHAPPNLCQSLGVKIYPVAQAMRPLERRPTNPHGEALGAVFGCPCLSVLTIHLLRFPLRFSGGRNSTPSD